MWGTTPGTDPLEGSPSITLSAAARARPTWAADVKAAAAAEH